MKRNAMSSQKIAFTKKIQVEFSNLKKLHLENEWQLKRELQIHAGLKKTCEENLQLPIKKARILDLGCGQKATQTILFHADGAQVTGIDIEVPSYALTFRDFIKTIRLNGWERALKSLIRHFIFDKTFFSSLAREYKASFDLRNVDTRVMDATDMSFDNETFDFIFSNSCFEHLTNVHKVIEEINRVLKPSGIAMITIHLFPSLSGGHHPDWQSAKTASSTVPPWDHLRKNNHPSNSYLNKLSLNQYKEMFYSNFNVIKESKTTEGEVFLTNALMDELSKKNYSKEDLLTNTITFTVKKKD